jgi:hypothetical protein
MDNRSVLHLAYQASKVQEEALRLLHQASVKDNMTVRVASRWIARPGEVRKLAIKHQDNTFNT